MRTLRNVTFVILCAMVYLAPVQATASCQIFYTLPCGSGATTHVGECGNCGDGYGFAADFCGGMDQVMTEYFCNDEGGYLRFCCVAMIFD
jgi:hypothetical protein